MSTLMMHLTHNKTLYKCPAYFTKQLKININNSYKIRNTQQH